MGICLASVDLQYLDILNKYKNRIYEKIDKTFEKYNSINVTKVHEKAKRGGFFGGYPFIINRENKIKEIIENFNKFKINLLAYPWPLHHKMKIFNINQNDLINTEELENKFIFYKDTIFFKF